MKNLSVLTVLTFLLVRLLLAAAVFGSLYRYTLIRNLMKLKQKTQSSKQTINISLFGKAIKQRLETIGRSCEMMLLFIP